MIKEILAKIGLDEKDQEIYLALIKLGPSSASSVAKETSLPRQTVYSILERLISHQVIEQSTYNGVKQFIADPNHLLKVMEKRRAILEDNKKHLEKIIPDLLSEHRRAKSFPVVQYYDGQIGLQRLFENILDKHKKGKIKSFRGYGINNFYPKLENFMREFIKKRSSYGVESYLMIADSTDEFDINTEGNKALRRNIKKIKIEPQQAAIYIVGNNTYLFSYRDNVGVMVENQAISQLLREVFDEHWGRVGKN